MAIGKILLIILGALIGTGILAYGVVWLLLQLQKIKLKELAEKEWMRINNIPEPIKVSW